ncbi:MAG: hypothetical protein U0572_11260 [Phycisphaerales bacterium]
MGLFSKKLPLPNPTVLLEGVTAEFYSHGSLQFWSWSHDSISFTVDGSMLHEGWLEDSRAISAIVRTLRPRLAEITNEALKEWPCDPAYAEYNVTFSSASHERRFEIAISNMDRWGDLAIDVTVEDGEIVKYAVGT